MPYAFMICFTLQYVWTPDVLSTSQTPPKFTNLWTLETSCLGGGFSNTNPDGYGVSYIIVGEDLCKYNHQSFVTQFQTLTLSALLLPCIIVWVDL